MLAAAFATVALLIAGCVRSAIGVGANAFTAAPRGDGGARSVGVDVDVRNGRIDVTFFRKVGSNVAAYAFPLYEVHDAARSFHVDPDRIDVSIVDQRGRTHSLRPLEKAMVTSTVAALPFNGIVPGDETAAVTYRIGSDVAPSLHSVSVDPRAGIDDSFGERLDAQTAAGLPIFVMSDGDRQATIERLRRGYAGKTVYGFNRGMSVQCGEGGALVVPSARVRSIERDPNDVR